MALMVLYLQMQSTTSQSGMAGCGKSDSRDKHLLMFRYDWS